MIIDITKKLVEKKSLQNKNIAIIDLITNAVEMYPNLEFGKILWMLDIVNEDKYLKLTTDEVIDNISARVFDRGRNVK